MRRQWRYANVPDSYGMHLSEIEMIDNMEIITDG